VLRRPSGCGKSTLPRNDRTGSRRVERRHFHIAGRLVTTLARRARHRNGIPILRVSNPAYGTCASNMACRTENSLVAVAAGPNASGASRGKQRHAAARGIASNASPSAISPAPASARRDRPRDPCASPQFSYSTNRSPIIDAALRVSTRVEIADCTEMLKATIVLMLRTIRSRR